MGVPITKRIIVYWVYIIGVLLQWGTTKFPGVPGTSARARRPKRQSKQGPLLHTGDPTSNAVAEAFEQLSKLRALFGPAGTGVIKTLAEKARDLTAGMAIDTWRDHERNS